MDMQTVPCYFLAANAPSGFCSRFSSMYDPAADWRCVILKGGPGSGKSTLMKKIARAAQEAGQAVELIYCSSDPRSLDGVILPDAHKCIADGTAPHVMEPLYPGACETLFNPGDCWDTAKLFAHRDEIRALNQQVGAGHRRAAQLRTAAGTMLDDARALAARALDSTRLELYCGRLRRRLFRGLPKGKGTEHLRFLSGITPDGWVTFDHTLSCCADRVALIRDDTGIAAPTILSAVRDGALTHGCTVITCCSPMHPEEPEAVILPELRMAFAVTNGFLRYDLTPERIIHARRFTTPIDSAVRKQIRTRLKAASRLLDEACIELQQARALHDQLEAYYMDAMDYDRLNEQSTALIQRFLNA